jgi:hypothetical protein
MTKLTVQHKLPMKIEKQFLQSLLHDDPLVLVEIKISNS